MKTLLISLLTMLVCSVGWACESYEECIEQSTRSLKTDIDCSSGHCWTWIEIDDREICFKKAIQFRLDEIAQKLDKPNGGCWVLPLSESEKESLITQNTTP